MVTLPDPVGVAPNNCRRLVRTCASMSCRLFFGWGAGRYLSMSVMMGAFLSLLVKGSKAHRLSMVCNKE